MKAFVKLKNFLFLLLCVPFTLIAGLPMIQGPTSHTSFQIGILIDKSEKLSLELKGAGKVFYPRWLERHAVDFDSQSIIQAGFTGLSSGKEYHLIVKNDKQKQLDERVVRTFSSKTKIKIAVASCMDDSFESLASTQWENLLSFSPDVIFLIGDNVYADRKNGKAIENVTPRVLWERYVQTRNLLSLFRSKTLVPVVSVWDDHDYGLNNGGADFAYKKESQKTFQAFFPRHAMSLLNFNTGPGVSSSYSLNGFNFVLLDNRSFRDVGQPQGSHYGEEQLSWLKKQLEVNQPTLLFGGDQFFGGYHRFESYEKNHPAEFNKFKSLLKESSSPFVLVSGDRHLYEVMGIESSIFGFKTVEITSSGIHAKVFPSSWREKPNPRQIVGVAETYNFAILDLDRDEGFTIKSTAIGPQKEILATTVHKISRDLTTN